MLALHPTDTRAFAPMPSNETSDYDYVRRAIEFISGEWKEQPSVAEIAAHVGLSESHLTHVFRRWAGLSPKAFLQALTLDHARTLLRSSASVLDAAYEVGLSGPGRLHDLFADGLFVELVRRAEIEADVVAAFAQIRRDARGVFDRLGRAQFGSDADGAHDSLAVGRWPWR